jgi:anti-sigma regulatory factor (Ser/Thr protein kinase)
MEMSFMASMQAVIGVNENTQIGEARRSAARLVELTSLDAIDRGKVAIIATELATNLVRHSGGGELIISRFQTPTRDGIELLAIDSGPGMADIDKCLQDGFSTAGTAGTGLGAIRRLSSEFDLYSQKPGGSVVVSRVLNGSQTPGAARWCFICIPAPGETLCGDNWAIAEQDGELSIMLVDGLGHGPLAAQAADDAVAVFNKDPFLSPGVILDAANGALRSTRGAAAAIARTSQQRRQLKFAGIGNISGTLMNADESRGLFSHNGTVGLQIRKIQEFDYAWADKMVLILHSDGLQTRWDVLKYPGLMHRHPAVIAGVLYRDFKRGRDDLTVAVVK